MNPTITYCSLSEAEVHRDIWSDDRGASLHTDALRRLSDAGSLQREKGKLFTWSALVTSNLAISAVQFTLIIVSKRGKAYPEEMV